MCACVSPLKYAAYVPSCQNKLYILWHIRDAEPVVTTDQPFPIFLLTSKRLLTILQVSDRLLALKWDIEYRKENEGMEKGLITRQTVRKNAAMKKAQREAKKYYGDKLFTRRNGETRAVIRKSVAMQMLPYMDLTNPGNAVSGADERDTPGNSATPMCPAPQNKEELLQMCREAGLTGRSGNGYATADKLAAYKAVKGTLLINGVECDPGLLQDAWIYRNRMMKVQEGVRLLDGIFHFGRIVLATKEPLHGSEMPFEQIKIRDRFPMGYENYLIKTALGRELPAGAHPTDEGILVLNLQTVLALAEIREDGRNAGSQYITVADMYAAKAYVVRVRKDSRVSDIVSRVFSDREISARQLYAGSGALHCHPAAQGECVSETTFFLAVGEMPEYEKAAKCAKCGQCSKNCPAGVEIGEIVRYTEKSGMTHPEKCAEFHPERCIGCGACTYGCYAGKDVRGIVAEVKDKMSGKTGGSSSSKNGKRKTIV